ncbi:MAG: 50S ribosomal protein L22 [Planctomycetes bacterium]|nr:50S ribosomal protein L22 [Planctomycetota bacterium]
MGKVKNKGKDASVEHVAVHRFVRIAARKCRLVVDLVRNRNIDDAIEITSKDPHRGAYFINKLLRSALAGALEKRMPNRLVVSTARVDEGPTLKRFRPRAQGRAYSILKRTSHIVVGLTPLEE